MILAVLPLLFIQLASAEPIEVHKQEVTAISKKTEKFERKIKELQERKKQAREGEELEAVLTNISNVHKELLGLRRDRNALKEHLLQEHPDSNLLFESSLHRSFDKRTSDKKGPLDDKLDSLLALMQTQYGKYITHEKEAPAAKIQKGIQNPSPEETSTPKPLTKEELKDQYMREKIKTEMKVAAPTPEELANKAAEAKAEAEKASAEAHKEPAKEAGHH